MDLQITPATRNDLSGLWEIFRYVVQNDDSHGYARDTSIREMQNIWLGSHVITYKVVIDEMIVGTFIIRPAYEPRAANVANASYMVHPNYRGKGVGRAMADYSLIEAKKLGYDSMLFKAVVSTNENAVKLWHRSGFKTIAVVPKAYDHSQKGFVDLFIMWRSLEDI